MHPEKLPSVPRKNSDEKFAFGILVSKILKTTCTKAVMLEMDDIAAIGMEK
jgi:hypothetical protein